MGTAGRPYFPRARAHKIRSVIARLAPPILLSPADLAGENLRCVAGFGVRGTLRIGGNTAAELVALGGALIPLGKYLNTAEDVLANPQLLAGKNPAEVQAILGDTTGWSSERLGKGAHKGQGWVLREYNAAGNRTGRMLRWHPGGGQHGQKPYWRVNGHDINSMIIPAGSM